jgi:hypothetical protein
MIKARQKRAKRHRRSKGAALAAHDHCEMRIPAPTKTLTLISKRSRLHDLSEMHIPALSRTILRNSE